MISQQWFWSVCQRSWKGISCPRPYKCILLNIGNDFLQYIFGKILVKSQKPSRNIHKDFQHSIYLALNSIYPSIFLLNFEFLSGTRWIRHWPGSWWPPNMPIRKGHHPAETKLSRGMGVARIFSGGTLFRKISKKYSKIFFRKLLKCIILAYFSKMLAIHELNFCSFGPKTQSGFWRKFSKIFKIFLKKIANHALF